MQDARHIRFIWQRPLIPWNREGKQARNSSSTGVSCHRFSNLSVLAFPNTSWGIWLPMPHNAYDPSARTPSIWSMEQEAQPSPPGANILDRGRKAVGRSKYNLILVENKSACPFSQYCHSSPVFFCQMPKKIPILSVKKNKFMHHF
jgi:hypothetical protein